MVVVFPTPLGPTIMTAFGPPSSSSNGPEIFTSLIMRSRTEVRNIAASCSSSRGRLSCNSFTRVKTTCVSNPESSSQS